jgi:UDP-N-acetylmuramate dehydrogenase
VITAVLADALERALPGRVTRDAPSAALTTYRCGGALSVLVRAGREEHLTAIAGIVRERDARVLVIGRGSNLLVADRGFDGVAILLEDDFDEIAIDAPSTTVRAGGAVALPVLARRTAAAGVGGLEFYVGIPGSVGGAVRMNAGGHGRETKDVLRTARLFSFDTNSTEEVSVDALALGFRTSAVGPRTVVLQARFAGEAADPASAGEQIDEIVRWRREHQPGGQNAGSVFVNPPGDAAGRLVEAAGAKGRRVGGAVVSDKHANFIVAESGATAADVAALIRQVQGIVERDTGVRLRPELHMVGFDEDAPR